MTHVSDIAEALGKARIARRVGCGNSAVTNAIKRGRFPASWRAVILDMAAEKEITVREEHFYARAPVPVDGHSTVSVDSTGKSAPSQPAPRRAQGKVNEQI